MDTGASYTWAPRDVLARLGMRRQFRRELQTADGRIIERDMAVVMARLNGQALPTPVVFGDEGGLALGAVTLEEFGLGIDPLGRRLIPVRGYAL